MSHPAVTSSRRRRFAARVIVLVGALAATAAVAQAQNPPEVIEYYATDALGSVRVVFTPTGQVIGRSDYLPFGDTLDQSGALPRQRFTGQERDGEAGLDDFNARSLQMRTGRMSSPDPLFGNAVINPQRWNRYAYVENNPLTMVDSTGLSDEMPELGELDPLRAPDDMTGYLLNWRPSPFSYEMRTLAAAGFTFELDGGGGIIARPPQAKPKVSTTWSPDLGSSVNVTLTFDVAKGSLTVLDGSDTYVVTGVTSGRGPCLNNPACAGSQGEGPIPAGSYTIWVPEISNPGPVGDTVRNILGDWGDWRAPVFPVPGTQTNGRSGFFLHGGSVPGSAGCIDIGGGPFGSGNTTQVLNSLKRDSDGLIWIAVK